MRAVLTLVLSMAAIAAMAATLACTSSTPTSTAGRDAAASVASQSIAPEAGFLQIPPRDVTVKGTPVSIAATARLFYNLRPADESPEAKPIFVLFNGFADDIVRPYGTGPMTVAPNGDVVANPTSFTRFANLVYVEPRQAGYSYDVLEHGAPGAAECASTLFNEYVDAADVLLGVLGFLTDHPALRGPVYWLGESYGGVRVTWILTYLRGRWDLVPYSDALLETRLASMHRESSLFAGQILLEGWLAGGADTTAITAECDDPVEIAGVSASLGASCGELDACGCALMGDRSLYNYTFGAAKEAALELAADVAHVDPKKAEALLGVPLASISMLASAERAKGYKCSPPDDTVPSDQPLVAALGALPSGQSYFVPYSPLEPGKETAPTTPDWRNIDDEALAFVDNLRDVPAFLTKGDRDLVVPTLALAPALRAVIGASRVDAVSASRLGVRYSDGERYIQIFDYPAAGHMVSMVEGPKLANDVRGWLASVDGGQ
jgi:hypothetical protein